MLGAARTILRMRRNGIKIPIRAYQEARRAKMPLAVLCAVLEQESGGGTNEFGHDPTIFAGAGKVTKRKYNAYKKERVRSGNRLMQGVGPMQLTYYSYQDKADRMGGCWNPRYNLRVGIQLLKSERRVHGSWHNAFRSYNGSEAYANEVMRRVNKWKKILT